MSKKQSIDFKYSPVIIKIPKNDGTQILTETPNVEFSSNVDYPRSEFGFHHFIHANKNKMDILKQFEDKKKVYLVMNQFEKMIDNYEEGIEKSTRQKLNISDTFGIVDRKFYSMWEILIIFDLINKNNPFSAGHLNERSGAFLQAVSVYRDTYSKKNSSNDKYYVETDEIKNADKNLISSLKGKIISQKTIDDQKLDLVTADINFANINNNVHEQEAFVQILTHIISGTKLLKKGGIFICRFYETYTKTSVKIIEMLSELYENVYFIKPLMSETSNSEKFAVCINFMFDKKDKKYKDISDNLNSIHKSINNIPNKLNITNIFSNHIISKKMATSVTYLNCVLSNIQLKNINDVVKFVKKEIYFGEEYHDRRELQIESTPYWINMYLSGNAYPELVDESVKKGIMEEQYLESVLVTNL